MSVVSVLEQYNGITTLIGVLVGIIGLLKAVYVQRLAPALYGIVTGAAIMSAAPLLKLVFGGGSTQSNQAAGAPSTPLPSDTAKQAATSAPSPTVDAKALDLSWVPGVLIVAGIAIAVLAAVLAATYLYTKTIAPERDRKRTEKRTATELITEARKTLNQVVLDSASYETDLAKQIDYPMMTDVSEPLVGKYIREMRVAQELERAQAAKPTLDGARAFSTMAVHLKVSFEAAVQQAEKVRRSNFTAEEQKRLMDARVALAVIQDSTTTTEQRNAQYRRIAKLLDGLIVLTEPVKMALGRWVPMLAIEEARDASSDSDAAVLTGTV